MKFSECRGRKVVSTTAATTIGKVKRFVIDPQSSAVIALLLKKTEGGNSLRWSDITAFGVDAVTVDGVERLTGPDDEVTALSDKDQKISGKLVLSVDGDALGAVDDVEFDPETGAITSLVLDNGSTATGRLIGVGSYAVVIQVADES